MGGSFFCGERRGDRSIGEANLRKGRQPLQWKRHRRPLQWKRPAAPFNGSALPPPSMEAAPPSPSMDATLPSPAPVNGANAPIRAARSSIVGGSFFVGILKRIKALAKPILARKCAASTAGAPHTPVYGMRPALSGLANSSFCRRLRLCRSRIWRSAFLCTCRRKSF